MQMNRVSPLQGVTVRLFSRYNEACEVVVLDLESEEATVLLDVPPSEGFAVAVGETAMLLLYGADPNISIQVRGKVVFQSKSGSAIRYQFRLDDHGTRHLNNLVERRRSVRVRPDPYAPVDLIFQDEDGAACVHGFVRDVSDTGISVLVDPQEEQLLFSAWKLRLSVCLPGEDVPVEVVGIVRYRKLTGSVIQYGIEFDPEETAEFAHQQERLTAYVSSRQNALN